VSSAESAASASSASALESELKQMIVRELNLEDVDPAELKDDAPLFGDGAGGLGLDSLDAVELVVLLQRHYQVEIKDMEQGREVFATIQTLADHVRGVQSAGRASRAG